MSSWNCTLSIQIFWKIDTLHFWIGFCICMHICIVSWFLMIFNTFLERFYLDNLNQETCLCFESFFKDSMSGPNDIKKLMMQILITMEQKEWVQICRYTRNVRFHDDILTVGIKALGRVVGKSVQNSYPDIFLKCKKKYLLFIFKVKKKSYLTY